MSIVSKKDIFVTIIGVFSALQPAIAQANMQDLNVRESCRRAVAGPYLSAYDRQEKAKQQLIIVSAQKTELQTKLGELEKELKRLRTQEEAQSFSIDIAAQKTQLMQTLTSYRTQVKAYDDLHQRAKEQSLRYNNERNSIAKAMEPVFRIVDLPATESDTGYPFRVDYRHACSKYRRLCPLPVPMARHLKTLSILGETPKDCIRYANFSNLDR